MLACRILNVLVPIIAVVTLPIQLVTTTASGCAVGCTFGLLLIPLSLMWMALLGVLVSKSWLYLRAERLQFTPLIFFARLLIAVPGIPFALLSAEFVALIGHMGDFEGRKEKLVICWMWPYTFDYLHLTYRSGTLSSPDELRRSVAVERALAIATGSR